MSKEGEGQQQGPFAPGTRVNTATAILFSLKTMELLENRLKSHSNATPLFSMTVVSLASSQDCRSVDSDAWCKQAITMLYQGMKAVHMVAR